MAFIRLIEATEDIMRHSNGISKLEQELRELSSTSSREVWSRKKRSIYPELYDYVLEKSNS